MTNQKKLMKKKASKGIKASCEVLSRKKMFPFTDGNVGLNSVSNEKLTGMLPSFPAGHYCNTSGISAATVTQMFSLRLKDGCSWWFRL